MIHPSNPYSGTIATPWVRVVVALTLLATLVSCAVGPDFHAPAAPTEQNYTPTPVPATTVGTEGDAGRVQHFEPMKTLPADWWALFESPGLDQVIREGLAGSPSVRAASDNLRAAQATLDAESAALFFPGVNANLGATRQRISGASFGQPGTPPFTYNLYNASVAVSYSPDVFGGSRRTAEGYRALVDYQRYELEAAYLTLTSNLVTTAVAEASYRGQLDATNDIVTSQRATLKVVERQFESGAASKADVLLQKTQLASTESEIPPLQKALAQTRHRLAVLTGDSPNRPDLPEFTLDSFKLPTDLPVSLPSELVHNRPDIQASEALLHQASANVGVATANLYPQITLTGGVGSQSTLIDDLFKSGSGVWSLGGNITQPLFHAGELRARKRAAEAQYDASLESYRSTVLDAFGQVADVLRAIEWDAYSLKAAVETEGLAKQTLDLTQRQFDIGAISYLSLLNAQRQYFDARRRRVQAEAVRYADTAALYVALGGGWWNRDAAPTPAAAAP